MAFDVGLWGAFVAGLLSFVSPCILPIVPPYLCYLAGVGINQFDGDDTTPAATRRLVLTAVAFVAGFTVIFVAFGASATWLGKLVEDNLGWMSVVAGVIIMIMGLHFIGLFRIGFLNRDVRLNVERKPAGLAGAFVMGLAFAFGWTPCVGPVLAAILFTAGTQDAVAEGVRLLTAYSLGIGLPFIIAAMAAGPFMQAMRQFRPYMGIVEKIIGVLLVLTGLLFVTGSMNTIGFYLLKLWPTLGKVG